MKLNQLTFTRFLAAVAIVILHYGLTIPPFKMEFLFTLLRHANIAVSYFFVLSGFVMVIAYAQKGTKINFKQYYINRFTRIYPVYIAALVIITALLITKEPFDLPAFLLSAFLMQAWIPAYATTLNYPGWSLSTELLFYAIFPLLFNGVYIKNNLRNIAIIAIAVYIATQIFINYVTFGFFNHDISSLRAKNFVNYFPLLHVGEFLIGNLTAFIYIKKGERWRGNYDVLLLLIIALTVVFLGVKLPINSSDGFMSFFFALFILFLALNNGMITKVISKSTFILLGEASYALYILQFPVHAIVGVVFKKLNITSPVIGFYGFLVILIIVSLICYHFFEVPARDNIRGWFANNKRLVKNRIYTKI